MLDTVSSSSVNQIQQSVYLMQHIIRVGDLVAVGLDMDKNIPKILKKTMSIFDLQKIKENNKKFWSFFNGRIWMVWSTLINEVSF